MAENERRRALIAGAQKEADDAEATRVADAAAVQAAEGTVQRCEDRLSQVRAALGKVAGQLYQGTGYQDLRQYGVNGQLDQARTLALDVAAAEAGLAEAEAALTAAQRRLAASTGAATAAKEKLERTKKENPDLPPTPPPAPGPVPLATAEGTGCQAAVPGLTDVQAANAATIVQVGRQMGIPERGLVIGVATAIQESSLRNLANETYPESLALTREGTGADHDSLGLFQQRPATGWGAPADVMRPEYAAGQFYQALLRVPGWQDLPLSQAAQAVQRSAFPDAYGKHETQARQAVSVLVTVSCVPPGWVVPVGAPVVSGFHTHERPGHHGVDLGAARGAPVLAAASGTVLAVVCNASTGNCDVDGSPAVSGCGWYVDIEHGAGLVTRYCHLGRRPVVRPGDQVGAGQQLGVVGSSGNSSGPHLHFEVRLDGAPLDPVAWMRGRGAPLGDDPKGG
ncbi:M23 family metallopeptidase [Longispora albida]|uniref:M23 family metallopeptidase n=1 Tax=Longispora albida TaxID=203523 RepID=UPI001FDEF1D0|nr:M23 family metallopeptidase [Longispora albida]